MELEEKREVCEGCRSGNYWMCKSFPGVATDHIKRELEYRKAKAKRRKERKEDDVLRPTQVYRRDQDE